MRPPCSAPRAACTPAELVRSRLHDLCTGDAVRAAAQGLRIAPGARAHYRLTITNTTDADWPDTTRMVVAGGAASELYDAASWTSSAEVGAIGTAIPAGSQGLVELDVVAPNVAIETAVATELALTDGTTQVGTVSLAVTVTPNGDENLSGDSDDQTDGGSVSGGCSAGGGAGWLAFAPVLLVLRRRRRG